MDFRNFLAGGAILGLVAACWSKIKEVSWRLLNLLVQQIEVHSESAHDALIARPTGRYR